MASLCTKKISARAVLTAVLGTIGTSLHGCMNLGSMHVTTHGMGNWEMNPAYLENYEFLPPGANASSAVLNSCQLSGLAGTLQCSGHGYCRTFHADSLQPEPISFCQCDARYADPECRTARKSQVTAFLLSLGGGFLGLDAFYLGLPLTGFMKLFTLGGGGFWWLVDIVRTGSAPVYARNFRVEHNLPHWVFVIVTVVFFVAVSFALAVGSILGASHVRRKDAMALQNLEESRPIRKWAMEAQPFDFGKQYVTPDLLKGGYGATLPVNLPTARTAYATPPPPGGGPPFAGPYGPADAVSPMDPPHGIPLGPMGQRPGPGPAFPEGLQSARPLGLASSIGPAMSSPVLGPAMAPKSPAKLLSSAPLTV